MNDDTQTLEEPVTRDWEYRRDALDYALRSSVGMQSATDIVERARIFLAFLTGNNG